MPLARTREGMIRLGDVFWGRVNSCRADRSVSFRVGGAALALIIVGAGPASWGWYAVSHRHAHFWGYVMCNFRFWRILFYTSAACDCGTGMRMNDDGRWPMACHDDLHLYYTHIPPRPWAIRSLCLLARTFHEGETWV